MKRVVIAAITVILMSINLAACGLGSGTGDEETKKDDKSDGLDIVTTIFPEYDWVRNILGARAEEAKLTLLLDNGVDLHSYQPTAEDILKVASCDLFIYVGGESDEWVEDVLKEATNKEMVVVDLLDVLGDAVKEEEIVEGMQEESLRGGENQNHGENSDGGNKGDEGHENGQSQEEDDTEYDEHVWLSLRNAQRLVNAIAEKLAEIDPENGEEYRANAASYNEKLAELDKAYRMAVKEAPLKTVLFGDRFPFRYLADDYDLDYYAAFAGCSAETEASFETIIFLAGKVNELGLKTILTIENSDIKIAKTIAENTEDKDQRILAMDSMQSVTLQDVKNGTTYLSLMEKNLSVLKQALMQ